MAYATAAPTGPKNVEWTEETATNAVPYSWNGSVILFAMAATT